MIFFQDPWKLAFNVGETKNSQDSCVFLFFVLGVPGKKPTTAGIIKWTDVIFGAGKLSHFLSNIPQRHVPGLVSNNVIIGSREIFEVSVIAANGFPKRPSEACFCADRQTDCVGVEYYNIQQLKGTIDLFTENTTMAMMVDFPQLSADLHMVASKLFSHLYMKQKFVEIRSSTLNTKKKLLKVKAYIRVEHTANEGARRNVEVERNAKEDADRKEEAVRKLK